MKIANIQSKPYQLLNDHEARLIQNHDSVLEASMAKPDTWQLGETQPYRFADLQAPIPDPNQIFAIGMNFAAHSKEIHLDLPKTPSIFTKFPSAITGPTATIHRHGPRTDWETELVAVIGVGGRNIKEADAAQHIAGYMVGEDLSDRDVQFANDPAQFSLGKSFENFAPIGPWLTTPDEATDLGQREITTTVNDTVMQHAPLAQMVFSPAALLAYLSTIVELRPGDLLFTGTPVGTGVGHQPPIFLQAGDQLTGSIDGLGHLQMNIAD